MSVRDVTGRASPGRRTTGLVYVALAAALFGTLGIFGRAAAALDMSMVALLAPRFVIATGLIWALLAIRRASVTLDRSQYPRELGLGVVYGVMSLGYFESLIWLSAGIAVLILFTYPVQVTLLAAVALDEPMTLPKLVALVSGVTGVALVMIGGGIDIALPGVLLAGLASMAYAVYTMGTRVMVADVAPLVHVGYVFLGTTVTVLVYGLATATLSLPNSGAGWSLVGGITVVGTLIPIVLFTEGLVRIEASRASIVSTSEPLTTVILGIVLLGEPFTPGLAGGAVLILVAVVLATAVGDRVMGREGLLRTGGRFR